MTITFGDTRGWAVVAPAFAGATLLLTFVASGCAKPDDEGPPIPKKVVFEGAVDSRFVGRWRTADGREGLDLDKAGSAKILASQPTPKGYAKSTLDGQWLATKDSLLLRYTDHTEVRTIKYTATLSGASLTLSTMNGRLKTKYLKQP